MIVVPPLPVTEDGWEFIAAINEANSGWRVVGLWGRDGWNLGRWPLQIALHYDGERTYAFATRTEGDFDVKQFHTREGRDHATDEWFVWFNNFHEVEDAPRSMDDPRLGPYRS